MNGELILDEKDRDIFEFILDSIPDCITVVDAHCKVIFFNKSSEKYFNLSRKEIIGNDLRDFFPSSLLPKVIELNKSYDNIYNSCRENSYTVISALPLYNSEGQIVGGLARDRDITELVNLSEVLSKTQASLHELEKEYSKFTNNNTYFSKILTRTESFIQVKNLCKNIAKTPMNILLKGESGTGKELFAKAIHYESGREGKYVPINCSAIPLELFESELFGYESGAFTGAKREGKKGKFEEADKGTLFLDEIGDMPMEMQPKILRALEEGMITRVGSNIPRKVDVRIISASNKDIRKLIKEGKFRKDLYYRLDVFNVEIPPLRQRKPDISYLANVFLQEFCMELGMNILVISKSATEILENHKFDGNVRELRNIIQRAIVLAYQSNSKSILPAHLPDYVYETNTSIAKQQYQENDLEDKMENVEKAMILDAMERCAWKKAKAARLLNIPRTTLYYKLEKYNIKEK